ncbi:MAG: SDR family oxidoreductase [Flavobacteriales bacterium]|jgi:short-subunit dehydrogenase|tara:strand:- start:3926 stop:4729 length:804 start_codon:yes stop_codon:yes gene_type:complete
MSKIVLVTGASSGIGKSIALFLSSNGFKVYGTCRDPKKYNIIDFNLLKCDITSINEIKECVNFIIKKEGRIDILINNAGIGITGSMEETSEIDMKTAFETNLYGPINIIKECIPSMRNQKSGLVINITSVMGYFALPFRGVYSATKSSMEIVGEAFSMELNKFNIKVVNIAPGDFKTDIISRRINTPSLSNSLYKKDYINSIDSANNHVKNALSPDIISKLVYKIIKSKNPKIHYKVGTFIQKFSIVLKGLLPDRLFEKILIYYNKN